MVYGVDDRGNCVSRRAKFIFVSWVGPKVGVMQKARVSTQRAKVRVTHEWRIMN